MPLYVDIHSLEGITLEDVTGAHLADMAIQEKYGVNYMKIGAATGDPVERDGDFFGSTVQLASRLCAHATAGQTLVSTSVTELNQTSEFDDVGEVALKGFPAPVRAHAIKTR